MKISRVEAHVTNLNSIAGYDKWEVKTCNY